jgi:hypothetical protein
MQSSSRTSIAALLLACVGAVIAQVHAQDVTRARYLETYVASGQNGLRMKLRLLKPLASLPPTGWLNSADEAVADGKFGGSVRKPLRISTKPGFVAFESEKRGARAAGRYSIENGVLTVCMLSIPPGAYSNVTEMTVPENYTQCAPMKLKS